MEIIVTSSADLWHLSHLVICCQEAGKLGSVWVWALGRASGRVRGSDWVLKVIGQGVVRCYSHDGDRRRSKYWWGGLRRWQNGKSEVGCCWERVDPERDLWADGNTLGLGLSIWNEWVGLENQLSSVLRLSKFINPSDPSKVSPSHKEWLLSHSGWVAALYVGRHVKGAPPDSELYGNDSTRLLR